MSAPSFVGSGALRGRVRVPGDKSISHRALILAALAEGVSTVRGRSDGDDVERTAAALVALGARVDGERIEGGRSRLTEPAAPLDLGNSGTGMRLLAGVAASLPFLSIFVGDDSLQRRPMDRVLVPLALMGARLDGRDGGRFAPIVVRGGGLRAVDYRLPVPSAQVKGAILLAGLAAQGETVVREAVATRRHTEELLALAGLDVQEGEEDGAHVVRLRPAPLRPFELDVPGDPSQAAFLVVAALVVPGSEIVVEDVYVGPGRAGFLDVLTRMAADIEVRPRGAGTADIAARHSRLVATAVGGAEVPGLIDEIPVLAVAACFAEGTTTFSDAAELAVKESDRIATVSSELGALGVRVETRPDGLSVTGGGLHGGSVSSHGDHRLAMALAIAGVALGEAVRIDGFDAVATSWPGFTAVLGGLSCG